MNTFQSNSLVAPYPLFASTEHALTNTKDDIDSDFSHDRLAKVADSDICRVASGRLAWMFEKARRGMTNLFTRADMLAIVNCYPQSVYCASDDIELMSGCIYSYLGIDSKAWSRLCAAPLIRKLHGLTDIQRLALVDLLEACEVMDCAPSISAARAADMLKLAD